MNFVDRLLDRMGLPLKPHPIQNPVEPHQESVLESSARKQYEVAGKAVAEVTEAVADLVAAMYEQKTALIKEFTQKVRSGEMTEQERDEYLVKLFGKTDTSELSPAIQEALKDALEKRGREDQEE